MFSAFKSLLSRRPVGARRSTRGTPSRMVGRRASLSVESLEDRCVPSTFNVIYSADSLASGTLRWAVANARNGDTINIQPLSTFHFTLQGGYTTTVGRDIVLTQGELYLAHNVTIESTGPVPTISGNNMSRVFEVAYGANVALLNLDVTQGNAVAGNSNPFSSGWNGLGGGVLNEGTLAVTDCTVSNNYNLGCGGGIYNSGQLSLTDCTVTGNGGIGWGGGIYNGGSLIVVGGSITDNTAGFEGYGGGIYNNGSAQVWSATLSNNSAGYGGGICNANGGYMGILDSTLSYNSANLDGVQGGQAIRNLGTLAVNGCTFFGNYQPPGHTVEIIANLVGGTFIDQGGNTGL